MAKDLSAVDDDQEVHVHRSLDRLLSYSVSSTDGCHGFLDDVYYDDRDWTVRYLAVAEFQDVDNARLISPPSVDRVCDDSRQIYLKLDREQVQEAPDVGQHLPFCLQRGMRYRDYIRWPYCWQGPYAWSMWPVPGAAGCAPPSLPAVPPTDRERRDGTTEMTRVSRHLRSTCETIGYHVRSPDGESGHVEDFLVDDPSWLITAAVVHARKWWIGKKVAIPAREFTQLNPESRLISVGRTRHQVKATRESGASVLRRTS